jgi:hypothetical protein
MPMKLPCTDETVTIVVELKKHEAHAYAQFLKRVCFNDYRIRAYDDDDAYMMKDAGISIRDVLAKNGFNPR